MNRIRIFAGLFVLLALLSGCGATSAPAPSAATTAPAASGATTAPAASGATSGLAVSARDAWVRAAVATPAGAMGEGSAMGHGSPTAAAGGGMAMGSPTGGPAGSTEGGMAMGGEGAGVNSAAYMTLVNSSATADALVAAASDAAKTVELHTVEMKDNVMQMRPVTQIDIPASGQVELKPGGFHVMLIGLNHDLKEGETVKLTLTLKSGGKLEVEAPVRKP